MDDDHDEPKSFEEAAREIADQLRRSIERASQADPEEIVRGAGIDPDRIREWTDAAGEWLTTQFEGLAREPDAPPRGPRTPPSEDVLRGAGPPPSDDVLRGAGPHPLDVPSREQGVALAALDSGRWALEPGTAALSVRGGGPGPKDALGLVRELRERDWIDADGAVTLVGRNALSRWLAAEER